MDKALEPFNSYDHARRMESAAGKFSALTGKQQKAATLILGGCAVGEVAKRVGVSRGTVYNWTHRSERFMAALESWKLDMAHSAHVRLLSMVGLASRAFMGALEKGDVKVAQTVFKALGVGPVVGEKEEEEVRVIYRREVDRSGGRNTQSKIG